MIKPGVGRTVLWTGQFTHELGEKSELRGYSALWEYLAGSAAFFCCRHAEERQKRISRERRKQRAVFRGW